MTIYEIDDTKTVSLVVLNEYFHKWAVYYLREHFEYNVQSCLNKGVSVHSTLDITKDNHLEIYLEIII